MFQHFLQNFILFNKNLFTEEFSKEIAENFLLKIFLKENLNFSNNSKLKIISKIRDIQTIKYKKKFFKQRNRFFLKSKSGYIR